MKGPAPIEIPDFFTVEWYLMQKELKKADKELAKELTISIPLLAKWKRKIGWQTGQIYKMCGRKKKLNTEEVISLKEKGLTNVQLADHFDVSLQTVLNYLNS